MRMLRPYLIALATCAVLVVLAEAFVDRPAARFSHDAIGGDGVLRTMQLIPEWLTALSVPVLVIGALAHLARGGLDGGRLGRWPRVLFLSSISLILAGAVKDALKLAFGHTWPETWINHNPSYIQNGIYGFFPFHGGPGYASFPSGHMTIVTATVGVFWIAWPRWRAVWVLPAAVTAIGLYGMDYHFIGDMIAGSFLGSAVAAATCRIAGIGGRAVQPL